jgi:uncharacterized cupredoxin-like copper-binding protein
VTRKFLVALAVIAIPLFLAACGDDDSSSTSAATPSTTSSEASTESSTTASTGGGGGETVDLSETEYKIDPADSTVKAGSVTFNVTNDGATVHNVEIEGNGIEEQGTDDLQPGDTGDLTVDLQPGTYTIYCSIDGHEDLGMKGEITVQ